MRSNDSVLYKENKSPQAGAKEPPPLSSVAKSSLLCSPLKAVAPAVGYSRDDVTDLMTSYSREKDKEHHLKLLRVLTDVEFQRGKSALKSLLLRVLF